MNETLQAILMFASLVTGYPVPDYEPVISYESRETMERALGIAVDGYYEGGVVHLSHDEMGAQFGSVVAHEFTHFLQDANGDDRPRCEQEREAYKVGDAFLWARGVRPIPDLGRLVAQTCPQGWEPGR